MELKMSTKALKEAILWRMEKRARSFDEEISERGDAYRQIASDIGSVGSTAAGVIGSAGKAAGNTAGSAAYGASRLVDPGLLYRSLRGGVTEGAKGAGIGALAGGGLGFGHGAKQGWDYEALTNQDLKTKLIAALLSGALHGGVGAVAGGVAGGTAGSLYGALRDNPLTHKDNKDKILKLLADKQVA